MGKTFHATISTFLHDRSLTERILCNFPLYKRLGILSQKKSGCQYLEAVGEIAVRLIFFAFIPLPTTKPVAAGELKELKEHRKGRTAASLRNRGI